MLIEGDGILHDTEDAFNISGLLLFPNGQFSEFLLHLNRLAGDPLHRLVRRDFADGGGSHDVGVPQPGCRVQACAENNHGE